MGLSCQKWRGRKNKNSGQYIVSISSEWSIPGPQIYELGILCTYLPKLFKGAEFWLCKLQIVQWFKSTTAPATLHDSTMPLNYAPSLVAG